MRNETSSRRDFLKASAVAGTALALNAVPAVHAAGSDVIKVGLIGCGGRGTGAAHDCLNSVPNGVKLTAMGDAFKDRLESSRNNIKREHGDKFDVKDDNCFVGLDAYKNVIDSGVDYVILASPPGFRPQMLDYAINKGKHVFTEKPVGVDAPGIRKVLAAYEQAKQKNLGVAAGTQRRHQKGYIDTIQKLHDGAIGDITGGRCYWNQGRLWHKDKGNLNDLEWQIRNWLYLVWLSGDHICEQHVHNLDVINWIMKSPPVRAVGMGGRQVRTGPEFGHIFDHFAVELEYPNGVRVQSFCRQIDGCENSVSEAVVGTRGSCQVNAYNIKGTNGDWRYKADRKDANPYVQEHTDLIESIRAGKPINELKTVAESTLTAIMGRMTCYTGKAVTWDQALNSQEDTMPQKLSWDMQLPVPPVATPGKTPLT